MAVLWWVDNAHDTNDADVTQAHILGLALTEHRPADGFFLHRDTDTLRLNHGRAPGNDSGVSIDFVDDATRTRHAGGKQSALARAFGLHRHPPMRVLDTTCGLGRDSAMLASRGCSVSALERQPALYALLADARARAATCNPPPAWLDHWTDLAHADAHLWLAHQAATKPFDAIYLDPMFVAPRRKARPQKALAWLGELAGPDDDAATLLAVARQHALRRVVVKQHGRSQPLAPPDHQVGGRAVRFDIYLIPGQ